MSQCRSLIRTLQSRIKQEFQHLRSTPVTKKHRESPPLYRVVTMDRSQDFPPPHQLLRVNQRLLTQETQGKQNQNQNFTYTVQEELPYHRHTKHTTHRNGSCNQFHIQ